ncbi:MAG: TonB-dependent receptor [Rikenellaceae bacterium]
MIKNIFIITLAVITLSASRSFAQEVKGSVVDSGGQVLIGATIYWAETNIGTTTSTDGKFDIHRVKGHDKLVASYVGYISDTITSPQGIATFKLKSEGVGIENIVVNSSIGGNFIKHGSLAKEETISFAGLCKMACCTLAESFENSAAVSVGYSDAISGARQIKMLGLTGTYTQILDENRPIMRGLSSPYGLSYTPGMWLNSIQVSKGISSVTAGHEAITGQINLEYRKPTDSERLFLNLYLDYELRTEINLSSAMPVSKDGKLSTVVLFHGSMDNEITTMDSNADGFRDMPKSDQLNLANRWSYIADSGVQLRWGFKLVEENRLGGDIDYQESMREKMYDSGIYGSQINNRSANGYIKVGMPVGAAVYDGELGEEFRSNIALVADFDHFHEDAYFGLNDYNGEENSIYINLMYNHYFSARSSMVVGASSLLQSYSELLLNDTPWIGRSELFNLSRDESEVGIYGEYTYNIKEKLSLVAGLRGDYNSLFDRTFITPRSHIKWNITPTTTLRGSAGLGYRSANVITDNIGILTTGRALVFDNGTDFDSQEKALTLGGSLTQQITLINKKDATISVDYFRSEFYNQVVADQEMDAESIHIYNTDGDAFTDTYQIDFTWTPIARLDIFATYRYTNSEMTINRLDGSTASVERPLVSRYKTLLNIQYATNMRRWTFDATAQYNGPSRLPTQDGDLSNSSFSPSYPMFFAQISRRIKAWEIYLGCENITNYKQESPILSADEPFSSDFNSSLIWGPLKGRKFYLGVRFNLY